MHGFKSENSTYYLVPQAESFYNHAKAKKQKHIRSWVKDSPFPALSQTFKKMEACDKEPPSNSTNSHVPEAL